MFTYDKDMLIAFMGDIHGDFAVINKKIHYYQLEDAVLCQLGDFGVGFGYNDPREPKKEKKRLSMLNIFLKKRNIFLHVVRGNHDWPEFFDGNHDFSNIKFLKDYDTIEVGDVKILGLGGAVSVDRKPNRLFSDVNGRGTWPGRREGINWWKNEGFVFDEEKVKNIYGVDIVFSHTKPMFVGPNMYEGKDMHKWFADDPELEGDLKKEGEDLDKLYKILKKNSKLISWFYAHFHYTKTDIIDGTKFCLLDIDEFRDLRI